MIIIEKWLVRIIITLILAIMKIVILGEQYTNCIHALKCSKAVYIVYCRRYLL
jgi:hypothetical protein